MKASLRERRLKASELARRAQAGQVIRITDRGRPIADLGPHRTGVRFARRHDVAHAFEGLPPLDAEALRAELDELADHGFQDPYQR
jgi:antitoxin (DNA-binding transcriptional repressor) of toxin-antitoxin stability system